MSDDLIPAPTTPAADRQTARLADVPELYRKTHERLAVELALHMDDAENIFRSYRYSPEQAAELVESPAFVLLLERVSKEVRESGLSFKTKAKAISEDLLPFAYEIATDPLQSAAVRADLIKWSAKVSGNEPKEAKDDGRTGGGLTLSIQFSGLPPTQVLSTHEPITIEQET